MTRRRWIADESSDNRAALTGKHADHLIRVLRARVGQEFDIIAGDKVRLGRVATIAPDRVEFDLGDEIHSSSQADITLLLSIFKFDRMEWAIEKCTELGATRIIPVIARRTDSHLATAAMKRVDRWRKIALQAAEQSRRASPPEIEAPKKLKDAIAPPEGLRAVLAETEKDTPLRTLLDANKDKVFLAIGPEGGWTEDELQLFQQAGWLPATLGPTILRAETAAIAAMAIVVSQLRTKLPLAEP